ncbi:MAG TPA: S8 family peptidase [Solirubrobacterales bacterium]|nr:S8 family peptidase [Solirubrobacterales bacterium]
MWLPVRRPPFAPAFTSVLVAALLLPAFAANQASAANLLVKFKAGAPTKMKRIPGIGVTVLSARSDRAGAVLDSLRQDPRVAFAERDATVRAAAIPNDYWWPSQWSPLKVNAPSAWELTIGSERTVVAVLDSGVDPSQPDLQGAFVQGRDLVNADDDPRDDYGHGTQVAGVAAARSNNSVGVASYCWRCSVMPVKVLGSNGTGSVSNVAAGIVWATDHGAKVINLSLGATTASTTLAEAAQYAHDRGVVLVAAAGNSSSSSPNYPAALPTVIGVAGSDAADQLTGTSNFGSWVDVAAPGCNFTTGLSSWYGTFCGTSSAAPVVAGIAGLALSLAPGASNRQVEEAIEATAVAQPYVRYGRVDAAAALKALAGSPSEPSPPTETTPPPGEPAPVLSTATFSGSLSAKQSSKGFGLTTGSGPLTATLTFAKASALTLTLLAADGSTIASAKGASGLQLTREIAAGGYRLVVSGEGAKTSFTLNVTYPRA